MAKTLYDKIWDDHVVHEAEDGTCLLYIDRHLVHEVTSPQAFEGLRMTGRTVRAPEKTIAVRLTFGWPFKSWLRKPSIGRVPTFKRRGSFCSSLRPSREIA